ncbi:hypothetical protein BHE74_00052507, partial [Ensete ventricosum]
ATCRRQPPLPTGDSPYGGHRCPRAITGHLYKWPGYGCPQVVPPLLAAFAAKRSKNT